MGGNEDLVLPKEGWERSEAFWDLALKYNSLLLAWLMLGSPPPCQSQPPAQAEYIHNPSILLLEQADQCWEMGLVLPLTRQSGPPLLVAHFTTANEIIVQLTVFLSWVDVYIIYGSDEIRNQFHFPNKVNDVN